MENRLKIIDPFSPSSSPVLWSSSVSVFLLFCLGVKELCILLILMDLLIKGAFSLLYCNVILTIFSFFVVSLPPLGINMSYSLLLLQRL